MMMHSLFEHFLEFGETRKMTQQKFSNHHELEVYRAAFEIAIQVLAVSRGLPEEEHKLLRLQMVRTPPVERSLRVDRDVPISRRHGRNADTQPRLLPS
jgi:hypothetical protein